MYLLNKDFVTPIHKVPNLNLELINDTQLELHKQYPEKYTLLIFYSGYHCPKCKQQLEERDWELYIATSISDSEPETFSESGLFFVKPDNTLYYQDL